MSEYTEMIEEGTICEVCGVVFIDLDSPGSPRACENCGGPAIDKHQPTECAECGEKLTVGELLAHVTKRH